MDNQTIKNFVADQLKAGLSTEDITTQLRTAGWDEDTIQTAFTAARDTITPTPPIATPPVQTSALSNQMDDLLQQDAPEEKPTAVETNLTTHPDTVPLPPPTGRSRFKTGLKLFTQSFRIMRSNPELLRYAAMSTLWTFAITALLVAVILFDAFSNSPILTYRYINSAGETDFSVTWIGFLLGVGVTYIFTVVASFYGVALASHALGIFRGQPGHYRDHIKKAIKKLPAILVFSLITTIVGYILRVIEERFRLIGWIVAKLLGALWTVATSFVLPVIADSDDNGAKAISHSVKLFKEHWGETIIGRVAVGGAVMVLYLGIGLPIFIGLAFGLTVAFGMIGALIAFGIYILGLVLLVIFSTLADSIITTSLYYYAQHGAVPPSYSPELLGEVFTEKKKKTKK